MRTPFSDLDYFVTAPIQALETLTIFQLPVAQVSPPPLTSTSTFSDLLFLRSDSTFEFSIPFENLPIETALSKFFSDVLPQNIATGAEDFNDDVPSPIRTSFGSRSIQTRISEVTHQVQLKFRYVLRNLVQNDLKLHTSSFNFG